MTNRIPDYLKLHLEEPHAPLQSAFPELDRLRPILLAATGFRLTWADEASSSPEQFTFPWVAEMPGDGPVRIEEVNRHPVTDSNGPSVSENQEEARSLASAVADALNQLRLTRAELRRREAELATSVPVVSVDEDGLHLAERLEGVLHAALQMTHSSAAALYLLDDTTTALKLRASIGLSPTALIRPPRPLELALADLEAMSGHAVIVEDARLTSHWNVPEMAGGAMCVPVASGTSIMGTLWLFRDQPGDFHPTDQNLAEVLAGRIASDLERTVLVEEVRRLRQQLRATGSTPESATTSTSSIESRLPQSSSSVPPSVGTIASNSPTTIRTTSLSNGPNTDETVVGNPPTESSTAYATPLLSHPPVTQTTMRVSPVISGWDVAELTRCSSANERKSPFTHWWLTGQDQLRLSVGTQHTLSSREGCLATAVCAHVQHETSLERTLAEINHTLWNQSANRVAASLFHAQLDPTTGSLNYLLHGGIHAYVLRPHGWEPLLAERTLLGADDQLELQQRLQVLMPGDVLFAMSYPTAIQTAPERDFESQQRMNQVAEKLLRNTHLSAQELTQLAARTLLGRNAKGDTEEQGNSANLASEIAVLVAKRSESN